MALKKEVYTGLGNFYGGVSLHIDSARDKYYLTIDGFDCVRAIEVSLEFALSFVREFKDGPKEMIFIDDDVEGVGEVPW